MKYDRTIEVCEYCDISYHPMPRWSKPGDVIFVHMYRFNYEAGPDENFMIRDETCEEKARAAGYELRMDLTPRR